MWLPGLKIFFSMEMRESPTSNPKPRFILEIRSTGNSVFINAFTACGCVWQHHGISDPKLSGFLNPISYTVSEHCWCVPSFWITDLALNSMLSISYPETGFKVLRGVKMHRTMVWIFARNKNDLCVKMCENGRCDLRTTYSDNPTFESPGLSPSILYFKSSWMFLDLSGHISSHLISVRHFCPQPWIPPYAGAGSGKEHHCWSSLDAGPHTFCYYYCFFKGQREACEGRESEWEAVRCVCPPKCLYSETWTGKFFWFWRWKKIFVLYALLCHPQLVSVTYIKPV